MQPSRENLLDHPCKNAITALQRRSRSENTNYHSSPYRYTHAAFVKIQITVFGPIGTVARHNGRNLIRYSAVRVRKSANCHSVDVLLMDCVRAMGMRVRSGETSGRYNGNALVAAFGRKTPSSELW